MENVWHNQIFEPRKFRPTPVAHLYILEVPRLGYNMGYALYRQVKLHFRPLNPQLMPAVCRHNGFVPHSLSFKISRYYFCGLYNGFNLLTITCGFRESKGLLFNTQWAICSAISLPEQVSIRWWCLFVLGQHHILFSVLLAHWIDMLLHPHPDTISRFPVNQIWLQHHNATCLADKQQI